MYIVRVNEGEAGPSELGFREVVSDFGRVKAVQLEVNGKPYLVRTELFGHVYQAFRAAGIGPPPRVVEGVVDTST